MIYTILLITLVSLLGTNASKPIVKMPSQMAEKFKTAATQCIKETGAPEDCLKQTLPWKLPQNELNENYLSCLAQTTKFAATDGHYIPEKVMRIFVDSDLKEDIEKIFTECNALNGENVPELIYKITDCFHTNVPVTLSL